MPTSGVWDGGEGVVETVWGNARVFHGVRGYMLDTGLSQ
jgi:hypothetical protein